LLYFAAVVLAVVDVFIPSGGLLTILAALSAIGSILFGFRSSAGMGMSMLTAVAGSIPVLVYFAIKLWPLTPIGRRVILGLPPATNQQEESSASLLQTMIGKVVSADFALMPAGQIVIGHRRFNAIAESGIIEGGQRVKVISVRERNLIVRVTSDPLSPKDSFMPPSAAAHAPVEDEANSKKSGVRPLVRPSESLLDRPAAELGLDSLEE
jgi:membrane-bound ClpP family serine protease